MELRKLKQNEHYIMVCAVIGLLDSITDYTRVSLDKFREISNNNNSIIEYALSISNDDIRFLFHNLEEAWQDWKVSKHSITLKEYLDYTLKKYLNNRLDDSFLVHNNGINYLLSSINEQLNPCPVESV